MNEIARFKGETAKFFRKNCKLQELKKKYTLFKVGGYVGGLQ